MLVAAANLLLAGGGWFLLVSPQRHHAAATAKTVADEQTAIARAEAQRSSTGAGRVQPAIKTADLYRLAKAMPGSSDQPDLLLQLDQLARESGVTVISIAPGVATAGDGYQVAPISLTLSGDFYELTDLLYRLRGLVSVHRGSLEVSGRLLAVSSLTFTPGESARQLNASVTVDAYVYGAAPAVAGTAAPAATSTSTTGTTTTSGTTTTATTTSGT